MNYSVRKTVVIVCLILPITLGLSHLAWSQNIVDQRILLNWGTWNWDSYNIHGFLHVGSGVPNGGYYVHFTERNGTNTFTAEFDIINGQATNPEWVWSDFTYQARFVPDGGWTMAAVSATGPGGVNVPASGENTVWRRDIYYSGNIPEPITRNFDLHVLVGGFSTPTPTPGPNWKCTDDKSGGNQENCQNCANAGMARYSVHSMTVSLNIEDTPLRYAPARGPAIDFNVTYNQKENQQPPVFSYSNLGPKWTFGWLSYVTDNPTTQLPSTTVYVPGGGAEIYPFDSASQTFGPDPQSHALLVRTGPNSYEKKFPDGSKQIFNLSSGAATYPRRVFMTQLVDPAGNSVMIGYDTNRRVTTVTDALGQVTTIAYELATDPHKITKVTDPFGRFATFQYENGQLKTITDEIGIQSQFTYQSGTDSIDSITTPYGTTTFISGESGTNRWIEITDPMGGKERIEYRDNAPGIAASDPVAPNAAGIVNAGLDLANTFYWDKKAMAVAPREYTKAKIKHWLYNANGSPSGILASEKLPLENRVWYTYAGQPDYQHAGSSAKPSQVARVLADGTTQLTRSEFNSVGKTTRVTDPAGRVTSYQFDLNQIDLLETRQTNGSSKELLRKFTYNSLHKPLTETDASGQVTTFTYNGYGQVLTRTNANGETTTYSYGGAVPPGLLASITSPPVGGVSAVTRFGYDNFNRVRTVTNEADQYTVTTDYDNLDRKIRVTYPDATYEEFQYTDNNNGFMTLDLTASRDRLGRWTYRYYDGNRKLESILDPLLRTTLFGWCSCGSLTSMTDAEGNVTRFNHDLQGRVYQKVFADDTTIDYLFEGQTAPDTAGATSRLQSVTDALQRRTNHPYSIDDSINMVTYTDLSGNPLDPPTASVSYGYDSDYNRITTMIDGTGLTTYAYYPIDSSPALGAGKLKSIDGPLANDTILFAYDELGQTASQSIDGVAEAVEYDALGRLSTTQNPLGKFNRAYEGVTARLRTLSCPNRQTTNYTYYGNDHDRRLQTLQNSSEGAGSLSRFDYTYNAAGEITSWSKLLDGASSGLWFDYDNAQQLISGANASDPSLASHRYEYGYDDAGNRLSDSNYYPRSVPFVKAMSGTFTSYEINALKTQIDSRIVRVNNFAPVTSELIYDQAGNLIDDGEGTMFEWDAANRLIAISYPNGNRTEFTHDGLGRRVRVVEKTGSTVISTQMFVWIGNRISQARDENNAITIQFFQEGEKRRPAGREGGRYFYTRDHLGSVREVTNSAGNVQARYEYDPYGKRTTLSGTGDFDLGYTGHYYHAPSGLNLTLYRAYDPALGRWLSRDPVEERAGLNLYGYVENDPTNAIDPLGLFRIYGNWCGPDWTGRRREPYRPDLLDAQAPINQLDLGCKAHDICYYDCRANNPCNGEMRSQCFRDCDRVLTQLANSYGGFWGRIVALAMDRPGKRDPEQDAPSCCQTGK